MPRDDPLFRRWDRYYAFTVVGDQLPVLLALAYRKNQSRRDLCALARLPRELLLLLVRHYRAIRSLPRRPSRPLGFAAFRLYMLDSDRRLLFAHYKAVWERRHQQFRMPSALLDHFDWDRTRRDASPRPPMIIIDD